MLSKIKTEIKIPTAQLIDTFKEQIEAFISYKIAEHKTDLGYLRFKLVKCDLENFVFAVDATKKFGLAEGSIDEIKDSIFAGGFQVDEYVPVSQKRFHDARQTGIALPPKLRLIGGCPDCHGDLLICEVGEMCAEWVRYLENTPVEERGKPHSVCDYCLMGG